jgi:hypothetical protein
MRKELRELVIENQAEILQLLESKGLVGSGHDGLFTKAQLTPEGKKITQKKFVDIPPDFIPKIRDLYPIGAKGTKSDIEARIQEFFKYNPDCPQDWDRIYRAAQLFVESKKEFAGYAQYFFSKTIDGNKVFRVLEYLEMLEDKPRQIYGGKIL